MTKVDCTYLQAPAPDTLHLRHAGDLFTVTLQLPSPADGTAWLRTNIGGAGLHYADTIAHALQGTPLVARDWRDLRMVRTSPTTFTIAIPLAAPGIYQAKTCFLPADSRDPVWPEGGNLRIKVEPAHTIAANTIYSAFPRQFLPAHEDPTPPAELEAMDQRGYTVIPPSGTFRELARRLDHITQTLGFSIVQLLPVFPTPTTYARMGRYGSPFAALDFMAVDPALAEFDRKTTPMDQFLELVDAVHARHAHLYLDIPINHTGWASWLQNHHPEWFRRDAEHHFRSPGAWGVTWEDLSELDYRHHSLWTYIADVFLFWCGKGVDGFRCDAGYMVPQPVWEFIVAKVRQVYPDTVFLLEGLGGKLHVTNALLAEGGLNWAYSELFQTYDRPALEHCLANYHETSHQRGLLVHFAETHDNNRLAAASPRFARMRTALAALASTGGGFGITNGVEWFATEKVDVHGASPLNWAAEPNQVDAIARLNALTRHHAAFRYGASLEVLPQDGGVLAFRRTAPGNTDDVLVAVNLDCDHGSSLRWHALEGERGNLVDLLKDEPVDASARDAERTVHLQPGQAVCIASPNGSTPACRSGAAAPSQAVEAQRARAKALALYAHYNQDTTAEPAIPLVEMLTDRLLDDPAALCAELAGSSTTYVTRWRWPADVHREVMLPPGACLLMESPHPFHVTLLLDTTPTVHERSLATPTGSHVVLMLPQPAPDTHVQAHLELTVFEPNQPVRDKAPLLLLATDPAAATAAAWQVPAGSAAYAISTNGRGALLQARADWGTIASQYDALLAANLHPTVPVDRTVLLTRCRAWIVHEGYSQELGPDCLTSFSARPGGAPRWDFLVPVGCGRTIRLAIEAQLTQGHNRLQLQVKRDAFTDGNGDGLPDESPVQLIIRPDVEDRNFHHTTKAYQGAEDLFPGTFDSSPTGFNFHPFPDHVLTVDLPSGHFVREPEWLYNVPHPYERERGLDAAGDLFSPGYFTALLRGTGSVTLTAEARPRHPEASTPAAVPERRPPPHAASLAGHLERAIDDFIVTRDDALTIIAGYPWFLDWGRDTLICLRGLIAAGHLAESRLILRQFARFEQRGTLPNMIRGTDHSNRDTSDAPLWFMVACRDLVETEGSPAFMHEAFDGRTPAAVVRSIADGYRRGTPNGIHMDLESGLIFSPPHFTWMDTNFPAGTPRHGYPIEIQALWYAGLRFVAEIHDDEKYRTLSEQVAASVETLFTRTGADFLSDCLHAKPGTAARDAVADDALRPNQLLALTLGLITDKARSMRILDAAQELLIPGAIRSLADRPVTVPVPVRRNGALLNDPSHPYWGHYRGDEDTRRKPAYHNGTAWTWPFPSFAEALFRTYGESMRETARSLLLSSTLSLENGCLGHSPEILDGHVPHTQRGCGAQAWGTTELYRVLRLLTQENESACG